MHTLPQPLTEVLRYTDRTDSYREIDRGRNTQIHVHRKIDVSMIRVGSDVGPAIW